MADHNNLEGVQGWAQPIAIFIGLFGLKDALPKLWGWLGNLINKDRERAFKKETEEAKAKRAVREELAQEKKEEDARIVAMLTQQLEKQDQSIANTLKEVKEDYKDRTNEMRLNFERSLELAVKTSAETIAKQDEIIRDMRKQMSGILDALTGIKQDAKDAKNDAATAKLLSTPENLVELAKRAKAEGLVDTEHHEEV